MDMNLKAFMKAELKERGTVEFPGVATFTDEKGCLSSLNSSL